ncbi:MAG: hypothetical protein ACWA5P_07715 [bacterium]
MTLVNLTQEYQAIVRLGVELIKEIGIQNFAGFIMENQYRVGIWSSYITLEFGKPDQNEILKISRTNTIVSACLEKIEQVEINELPTEVIEHKNNWLRKMKSI